MSREVPFFHDDICDGCGAQGAYDFMGDSYCEKCVQLERDAPLGSQRTGTDIEGTNEK